MISSMGKRLALALWFLGITTLMTTDATPTLATADEVREFKLWVQYARAAYDDVTGWKCRNCGGDTTGTRLIKKFTVSPTRDNGYVAVNDQEKAIIVAYRGTADLDTLKKLIWGSLPILYTPITGAWVVNAFLDYYHMTSSEIIPLIGDLVKQNPSYKVIATGHSLGGSLATLTTMELIENPIPGLDSSNLFTYTFGEPCNGNLLFTNFLETSGFKFFRLVDRNDIIPYLPVGFYNQYAPEYWINTDNKIVVCQTIIDPGCSLSLPAKDLHVHLAYYDDLASM